MAGARWVTAWTIPKLGRCWGDPQASDTKSQNFACTNPVLESSTRFIIALTLLWSNSCCLIKVTWSCSETDLIFRTLCIWLSIETIVWVHHMIINSPDFFIQALKLQLITQQRVHQNTLCPFLWGLHPESLQRPPEPSACFTYRYLLINRNLLINRILLHTLILINRLSLGQSV